MPKVSRMESRRQVVKKIYVETQKEREGVTVRRIIGGPELKYLDPFLLLDEFAVSPPAGFPDHPHRGFETVTYWFEGAFAHEDFLGHSGTSGPGDIQWMTAGRGIMHAEMPIGEQVNTGLQLWINLSSKDKMVEPRYQELQSKVSMAERDGVDVRIIAGESYGVKSPIYTQTPAMYLDFKLKPGAHVDQPVPEGWTALVYVVDGEGVFGSADAPPATAHHALFLGSGDCLSAWNNSSEPNHFVLIGGKPINEPVVEKWPFIMSTREEIDQAIEDFRLCRNGFENARHWKSRLQSNLRKSSA